MRSMLVRFAVAAALLGVASASGCNGGSSTGAGASHSSGSETHASAADAGPAHAELTSPPGSRDPITDDAGPSSTSSSTPPPTSTASSTTPAESPWGQSDADTGPPLPPRHEMSGSAQDRFREGMAAAARGDDASAQVATTAFQAALSADSSAFRAAYNLGVLADREGHPDQALTFYRQALRIQPDYELAIQGIVTIMIRRGDAAGAVAFVQPLAAQYVRNLYVTAIYGEALVEAHREPDAVTAARGALRRDERFVPAMIVLIKASVSLGRTELAASILDQALAIDPNNAELHYLHGVNLQTGNQLAQALQEYEAAVRIRPDYVDARMRLGLQYLAGARYEDARTQFLAVAQLVDVPEVHLNLGDAYRCTKQYDLAKAQFDLVIAAQPSNAHVHFDLGLMYMGQILDLTGQAQLDMLQQAQREFTAYRTAMGPQLPRDDQSQTYLDTIARQIERAQKALASAAARAARAAAADAGPRDGGSP